MCSQSITLDGVRPSGIDIKQATNARALVTLGKDMSLRDYSQVEPQLQRLCVLRLGSL